MSKVRIYSTKSDIESMGIQNHLKANGVHFEVMDKTDSSYASVFGDIEIYVEDKDQEEAEKLLAEYFKD